MQPRWPETSAADRADLAACRALLRGGSRSFHIASLLLPTRVRDPATALYAFCRVADDAVDMGSDPGAPARLRERLDRVFAGRPLPIPADRALAQAVAQFAVPRVLLDALLEGFAWDAEARRYDTFADLLAYAARVAGTVGAMMAAVMGARSPDAVARACDLGVAMQLSNIARDVGEDARAGRLYLPRDWLRAEGIEPEAWLARPEPHAAIGDAVGRLLAEAEFLYQRAADGIARLPWVCQPGIRAASLLYAEIGREALRLGPESLSRRAVVPASRKAWLLARSALPLPRADALGAPALPEVQFLVDAVAAAPRRPALVRPLGHQAVWVIGLFERLEREELARGQP
jgi:phytoene synthase